MYRQIQKRFNFLHIYIYNGSLQPFSLDYNLASDTTYVVCTNYINEFRDLQLKNGNKRQTVEHHFIAILVYSQSFFKYSNPSIYPTVAFKKGNVNRISYYSCYKVVCFQPGNKKMYMNLQQSLDLRCSWFQKNVG